MSCISCQTPTRKYKCTKCLEPYCSLPCYKAHQQQPCEQKQTLDADDATALEENAKEPTLHEPFRTEDTVPRAKLEQLTNSQSLRELLYNPHLRNLLHEIDVAPNAWMAMNAAMHEPLFIEFADECLEVIKLSTESE